MGGLKVALARAAAIAKGINTDNYLLHVRRQERDLLAQRRAWGQIEDDASRGRYLCYFKGAWDEGLPLLTSARTLEQRRVVVRKGGAKRELIDPPGLECLGIAQAWLAMSAKAGVEAVAQQNMRRRARAWFHRAYPKLSGLERARLVGMMDRLDDKLAMESLFPAQTFTAPESRESVLIEGGEWRVEGGCLIGRNTGRATRSTLRQAYRRITAVAIKAGIRSADNLNLRFSVGDLNVILNWELAAESHFCLGKRRVATTPPLVVREREHMIRIRQMGGDIVVFFDGEEVFRGAGKLDDKVSVYPAVGSEIFIRSVQVEGESDPYVTVRASEPDLK